MAVPTQITDLSQTAGINGPVGSVDTPSVLDDHLRAQGAFIAQLRDGKGFTGAATVASATTTSIGAENSLSLEITGATTITGFGTTYNGPRFLRFAGALTLTHSAALNLPGAANITTAAGDACIALPNAAGSGWNVLAYQRSAGLNVNKAGDTMTGNLLISGARLGVGTLSPAYLFAVSNAGAGGLEIDPVSGAGGGTSVQTYDRAAMAYTPLSFLSTDMRISTGAMPAERVRVDSDGNVGIAMTSPANNRFSVKGAAATAGANAVRVTNSANEELLLVRCDGAIGTGTTATSAPYNLTTAVAANMVIQADGFLYRSTSSARYKKNIRSYSKGLADLMRLRPVTYTGRALKDTEAEFVGFVAEEVHAAGFSEFVQYDANSLPDGVQYGAMVAASIKGLQEQQAVIEDLLRRVEKLEGNR